MNKTLKLILLVGGAWLAYRYLTQRVAGKVQPVQPLPEGATLTGQTKRTTNAGAPGEEIVGYGVRDWAEIILPSGFKDWVEVRRG